MTLLPLSVEVQVGFLIRNNACKPGAFDRGQVKEKVPMRLGVAL